MSVSFDEERLPLLKPAGGQKPFEYEEQSFLGMSEELYGYMLILLAAIFFSLSSFIVHLLASPRFGFDLPANFVAWVRAAFLLTGASLGTLLFVDYRHYFLNMSSEIWLLLIARGLVGAFGFLCLVQALSILPFGDAGTEDAISRLSRDHPAFIDFCFART
jgi:drug/metabolite transporter (DMT)-like permease